ncbi:prephenate dehydrogenase/arogenate dehydrogenase family protein [Flavobacterium sp. NST-5]|uniref:Prephenate dehydrogenase/arogenate dehydrogenase family protein n=1 Tax=Flavobacterium ichthyis TaxID=2698827 RepID=A0ABW9ZBL3_9FLAO|nr:NADPH-dependent F420 reductase [Flavobacterium ichthyis]NBL66114.1 prephenate dehydrogenase/arogenate dehydrogenase family protein [Flavobacterium ichthyis]
MSKIAFIGIGNVGFAIANNLQKKGHEIIVANNDENSVTVKKALEQNVNFSVKNIQAAIDEAEVVFLATPFQANEEILKPLKFNGKVLVDCTNPVGMGISHGLNSEISGSEKVQEWAPDAKVVKAFTIYGFENFINSDYPNYNVKPVMMIAGNDSEAKSKVAKINTDMGFETLDTGKLDQALHLEHMTLLWVKMVRRDGHHPNFVWAKLEK